MEGFIWLIIIIVFSSLALIYGAELDNGNKSKRTEENDEGSAKDWATDLIVKGTYDAPFDHYSSNGSRNLRFEYEANVEHFQKGGPLFFHSCFPRENSCPPLHWLGLVYDLARELNGSVIQADVRYFNKKNKFG